MTDQQQLVVDWKPTPPPDADLGIGVIGAGFVANDYHLPECSVWLESLIVPADSPADTWAAEQQAVASGIHYARETVGL